MIYIIFSKFNKFKRVISTFSIAAMMFSAFGMVTPAVQAAPRTNFKGLTIVVDPGHGGKDAGAVGPGGISEKFVNLSVGKFLGDLLHRAGARVVMTRASDRFVSLRGRPAMANAIRANAFVSVHQNSAANPSANGTETYYYHPSSARLTGLVHSELLKYQSRINRHTHTARFAVIHRTNGNMPSILTEGGFISNPAEAKRMQSATYRKKQAIAIYKGLQKQFGVQPPAPAPAPVATVPAPALASAVVLAPGPEQVKPLEPVKLQVQFNDKFGIVQDQNASQSQVHIPYATGNDSAISIRNMGGQPVTPTVIFNDLLGNKITNVQPFIDKDSSYSFYPSNVVGNGFIGSIDIVQPMGDFTSGITAGLVAQ